MIAISLGNISFDEDMCEVTVCLENGRFVEFSLVGRNRIFTIEKWYLNFDDASSPICRLIDESCSRFDKLSVLVDKSRSEGVVDFSLYGNLLSLGVDVSQALEAGVIIQGKRHYEIIACSNSETILEPPCRSNYADHNSYRQAMDSYMEDTRFMRKKITNTLIPKVTEVSQPSPLSITAYNESIALYQYQQRELDLLETQQ